MRFNYIFIVVFILIFISEDTFTFGTNMNFKFIVFRYIIYFVLTVFLLFKVRYNTIRFSKTTFCVVVVSLVSMITVLVNQYATGGYLLQLWLVLLAFLIIKYIDFDLFCDFFSTILFYLSIVSLIFFAAYSLFPSVFTLFPVTANYADVEFYNLYVCVLFKATDAIRNTSIFREPGVFVVYLIIAIIIELFKRRNNKYLSIYIIALFTTLSTAGYIIFLLVVIAKMFEKNAKRRSVYLGLGLILLVVLFWPFIGDVVFGKFKEENAGYASTLARVSSVTVPFSIFLESPFWGVGIERFVSLYPVYSIWQYGIEFKPEGESTNTILNTAAIYGMFYAILILYSLYNFSRFFVIKKVSRIIFLIVFILLSSNEELRFSLFFNVILLYGISCSWKSVLKLNKN